MLVWLMIYILAFFRIVLRFRKIIYGTFYGTFLCIQFKTKIAILNINHMNISESRRENTMQLQDMPPVSTKSKFLNIYEDIKFYGQECSPRGLKILEIENYSYQLKPYERFTSFEARKFSLDYIKTEFLWYLRGDRFDLSICDHASIWKNLVQTDGGINSNYGQYIFGKQNQFDYVVNELISDKDSRRASISILNKDHLISNNPDVPCTYSLNFRIRNNQLNMSVRMRSQDAIFGMTNDAPCFSFIHEMMYITLKETYADLKYGVYHHTCDSFHVYERHFNMLDQIIKDGESGHLAIECPPISGIEEVKMLRNLHNLPFDMIPPTFKFIYWLYNN